MPVEYPTESVPFSAATCMSAFQLLRGPGPNAVGAGIDVLVALDQDLRSALDGLRAARNQLAGTHRGIASEAAATALRSLEAAAQSGTAETARAFIALDHQIEYIRTARTKIEAIPQPTLPPPGGTGPSPDVFEGQLTAANLAADEVGEQFRGSANMNFGSMFASFEPPAADTGGERGGDATDSDGGGIGGSGIGSGIGGGAALPPAGGVPGGGGAGSPVSPGPVVPGPADPPTSGTGPAYGPAPGTGTRGGLGRPTGPGTPPATVPAPRPAPTVPRTPLPSTPDPNRATLPSDTGWQPGRPWTARTSAAPPRTGSSFRTGPAPGTGGRPAAPTEPYPGRPVGPSPHGGPAAYNGPPSAGPSPRAGGAGVPFLPATAGGGNRDTEHQRPPWLLQDDPESIWFAGLPSYVDPVIGLESPYDPR